MKSMFLLGVLLLGGFGIYAQETKRKEVERPIEVGDAYFWSGSEGNLGLEINGKFESEEGLRDTLDLSKEIGQFKDKKYPFSSRAWVLRDILVSVDFKGSGAVATWRVSGPKPLMLSYLKSLEILYESRLLFYDFGYRFLVFKPSSD